MDLQETLCGHVGLDPSGSGQGPVAGYCEDGNEHSGFMKRGEFLDQTSDYQLIKDITSWSQSLVTLYILFFNLWKAVEVGTESRVPFKTLLSLSRRIERFEGRRVERGGGVERRYLVC
jgi:hypothetical protein